jgi:hypothetical protein
VKQFLAMEEYSFDSFPWPKEILDSAKHFYGVYIHACLEWAGDVSDSRLRAILSGEERPCSSTLRHIVNALYSINIQSFIQFVIALYKKAEYAELWHDCFTLLAKIKDKRIEDFFIEFLIDDDRQRPWMTRLADAYLQNGLTEPAQELQRIE